MCQALLPVLVHAVHSGWLLKLKFLHLNLGLRTLCHITCLYCQTVVQWLKLPAWKIGDRGLEPRSGIQAPKKQNVSFPLTRKDSIL